MTQSLICTGESIHILRDPLYFCSPLPLVFTIFFASVDFKGIGLISQSRMYFRNNETKVNYFFSFQLHSYSVYFVKDWGRGQRTHRWTSLQAMILKIAVLLFMMLIPYVCSSQRHPSIHLPLPFEDSEHFPQTSKNNVPSNSPQTTKNSPEAAGKSAGEENYVTLILCSWHLSLCLMKYK